MTDKTLDEHIAAQRLADYNAQALGIITAALRDPTAKFEDLVAQTTPKKPNRQVDPLDETTLCLDDVSLKVSFRVNYKRPRDEAPEVYDITYQVLEESWLESAVHDALVEKLWEQEANDRMDAADDGDAKYDAWKEKQYLNAADAAEDFGMGKK